MKFESERLPRESSFKSWADLPISMVSSPRSPSFDVPRVGLRIANKGSVICGMCVLCLLENALGLFCRKVTKSWLGPKIRMLMGKCFLCFNWHCLL